MPRRAHRWERLNEETESRKVSKAAAYLRLSREDMESSIANQRKIIEEFVKEREDILLIEEFVDQNQSGTNFLRDGFLELRKAIQRQEIDCVIVKDLSRLGRNLGETCDYLEKIFPQLGVRFLSVLDRYDSLEDKWMEEQLLLQLKCLFHDQYAKDVSRKVHSAIEIRQRKGEITGSVPYGYQKTGKSKVEVTKAAKVVELIYQMALLGRGDRAIAEELDRMGVFTPEEFRRNLTKKLFEEREGAEIKKENWHKSKWQVSSVRRILKNRAYTGMLISHQSVSRWYEGERRKPVAKEDWICTESVFPVIISKEVFEAVQKIRCLKKHNLSEKEGRRE